MSDNTELKRLAEACGDLNWRAIQENWCEWAIRDDHAYIATMRTKSAKHAGPCPEREAKAKFLCAVTPAVVRALIDENERQAAQFKEWQARHHANYCSVAEERDHLKAEVAGLKTGYQAYELVNAELKAENEALRLDKDRLDALEGNFWDVRYVSTPIGDAGDNSTSVEIVGSFMDQPRERVLGEDYNENLRAAIDQAMKAPAYPPARPEYPEFDDIPDFTPGNGNSARRRAESLGIDYDAAMGKGAQS
ncbi:hypothetical protein [Pseudomonas marvdashtae]|uniref:hypothetical protein n=1 Tax=Pseudomonas marvdashtae TaxID=2745500 RepID=UPI001CEC6900|nr:hypothetical protein [Pseudomonas marvdashtae]